ncbi:MAG: outer membrane protein assembly factor BamC [Burkholderiales bacterium]
MALTLVGCGSTLLDPAKVEYKAERKLPPLDVPPDLTVPPREERYQIPDAASSGPTTYSAYNTGRAAVPAEGALRVLPEIDKARIERSASERWLVVSEPPEKVWPIVKEFWQELGFLIKVERPEAGVMETDWAENRAKVREGFFKNLFGGLLEGAYSTGERDKFRTRLERGIDVKTTEVYISHRGVVEVYTNEARDSTIWQPRPPNPGLEAEFLRRLMLRFGVDEVRARQQLAAVTKEERARIVTAGNGAGALELFEPFDRAWRRVGLVLDRVGFTVEDRDRSRGFYFVRYVDVERDAQGKKKEQGFFDSLMFWRSAPDPKAEQYRVFVKDRDQASEVQVLDREGKPDSSDTARRILSLLQQQLK